MDLEKYILLNTLYLNYYIANNNSGFIGTILMDLSKAHDYLPHDLIIAKFAICKNSLKLLLNYLEGRKQRVKIGSS